MVPRPLAEVQARTAPRRSSTSRSVSRRVLRPCNDDLLRCTVEALRSTRSLPSSSRTTLSGEEIEPIIDRVESQ
jgi:hypothetical protein